MKAWRDNPEFIVFLIDEYGSVNGYECEKVQIIAKLFKAFLFGQAVAR